MDMKEGTGRQALTAPAALPSSPPRVIAAGMADSVIARRGPGGLEWRWEDGILAAAIDRAGRAIGGWAHCGWAARAIGGLVDAGGSISGWRDSNSDLRLLQPGVVLASLYRDTGEERFRRALASLLTSLRRHPRSRSGGFWSSRSRPFQMWLDCTGAPFHALALGALGEPEALDDAVHQLLVMEECARDPRTGLPSHAWDESRRQLWSNPESGRSPCAWTRGIGLFLSAAVDTLEALPPGHQGWQALAGMIGRLAASLVRWQDAASGLWFQVTDQPLQEGNYLEGSGTCLLSYAFARAGRLGCLPEPSFQAAACRAFDGAAARCISEDRDGRYALSGCSPNVILGGTPYRDGTFACYTRAASVVDDPVGTAGFILAALERDDAGVRARAAS